MRTPDQDLPRKFLALLFLGLLMAGAFWVLRPFLAALLWGGTIVIATWPILLRLERWFGGRRKLAVTVLSLALLLLFVLPFFLAVGTLVGHADQIGAQTKSLLAGGMPSAPGWLGGIPLVGAHAVEAWNGFAGSPFGELAQKLTPFLGDVASWFAGQVGSLGKLLTQMLLTVVVAAVFWSSGEEWTAGLLAFFRRLAGEEGVKLATLAAQAVRGLALGIVVTAFVQAALGGIGLAIAGIPLASLLTVVTFILCIAQIGPFPVLVPAVVWLFAKDATGMAIFLLVWSLVVGTLDNFLRPMLIRMGADLPLLLVFAGVLGGLMSFGLVGLFIGPVVLAVVHKLLSAWVAEGDGESAPAPAAKAGEGAAS